MSAIVNLCDVFSVIFSSLCQFTQLDPFLIIPHHFDKKKGIQKVDGNFHIFKLALSIIRLFTREWHVLKGCNRLSVKIY
jgi:hypothetical protein